MNNNIPEAPIHSRGDGMMVLRFDPITCDDELPLVSVVTITRDRLLFYPLMLRNILTCDYPKDRMEWVVVEDGGSCFENYPEYHAAREAGKLPTCQYHYIGAGRVTFPIGYKRNLAASLATHDIIIHMDDDDYYPPESVLARARTLTGYKAGIVDCVGCTSVRTFNLFNGRALEARDTDAINLSESSLAYRRAFWIEHRFENTCSRGEGVNFLRGRHARCLSLPSAFVIVQLDHHTNTVVRRSTAVVDIGRPFLDTIDAATGSFLVRLRDTLALSLPETRQFVEFLKSCGGSMKLAARRLHRLPPKLQRHPLAVQARRTHRTTETFDVVFYCGSGSRMTFGDTPWSPIEGMPGGSEEAVVRLAGAFARAGRRVHVFNERDTKILHEGVVYCPWYTFCPLNRSRTIIVWRDPSNLNLGFDTERILLDLHDFTNPTWFDPTHRVDAVMLKSEFHRVCVPTYLQDRCVVIPNGVDVPPPRTSIGARVLVSTSSPERCWVSLFRLAWDLLAHPEFGDVVIKHAYTLDAVRGSSYWATLKPLLESAPPNILILGRLSHSEVEELHATCGFFVYPTRFPEIDCLSLSKAILHGCTCVHTNSGAMAEKAIFGTMCVKVRSYQEGELDSFALDDDEYVRFRDATFAALRERSSCEESLTVAPGVATANDLFGLANVARRWLEQLSS